MLTGKTKEEFELWYSGAYGISSGRQKGFRPHYEVFINQKLAFQWGVYLEFFDSVGIHIICSRGYFTIGNVEVYEEGFNSRSEAQIEAIKKADEIFNKAA